MARQGKSRQEGEQRSIGSEVMDEHARQQCASTEGYLRGTWLSRRVPTLWLCGRASLGLISLSNELHIVYTRRLPHMQERKGTCDEEEKKASLGQATYGGAGGQGGREKERQSQQTFDTDTDRLPAGESLFFSSHEPLPHIAFVARNSTTSTNDGHTDSTHNAELICKRCHQVSAHAWHPLSSCVTTFMPPARQHGLRGAEFRC